MTTIGLFGTCGASTWRSSFIAEFERLGIAYFNPQVDDWHAGLVEDENRHLAEDEIILFPVLGETTGTGSLGEIGFSIAQALRLNRARYFVFLIDDVCTMNSATPVQIKESNNARALVKSKLAAQAAVLPNIFLVETLDEMRDLAVELHALVERHQAIEARFKAVS